MSAEIQHDEPILKGKIEELIALWTKNGLVTILTPEEVAAIGERIHEQMVEYRLGAVKKEHQSYEDTKRIILNA